MIKLVIFDFDGVLVDSNESWADVLTKASKASGLDGKFTFDDIKDHAGKPYVEVFKASHPKHADNEKLLDTLYSHFIKIASTDEFVESFKSIKGIKRSLASLGKKYTLAVCSGNSRNLLKYFIDKMGFSRYFRLLVSVDDVKRGKPHPDMLLKTLKHFGVSPKYAVYIGDSESDVMAAKSAGVRSIVVLTGALDRQQAEDLSPDFIVDDVTRVEGVLKCM